MPLNSLFLLGWQEKLGYRFTFPYDYGLFVLVLFFLSSVFYLKVLVGGRPRAIGLLKSKKIRKFDELSIK